MTDQEILDKIRANIERVRLLYNREDVMTYYHNLFELKKTSPEYESFMVSTDFGYSNLYVNKVLVLELNSEGEVKSYKPGDWEKLYADGLNKVKALEAISQGNKRTFERKCKRKELIDEAIKFGVAVDSSFEIIEN